MAKSPTDAAAKWQRNLSAAIEDMRKGAEAVTVNPATKAMAAKPKMVANFTAAMAQGGKFDRAMAQVTLEKWRSGYIDKGLTRVSGGATAAQPKMESFLTKLIAYQQAKLTELNAKPVMNAGDAKNKMNAWFDYMSAFKK